MEHSVHELAHAKINLNLRVIGRRPDGFHELRTVFQSLALADRLTFVARPGPFEILCDTAGVPLDEKNLVWRAAAALWRELGREGVLRNVLVTIDKRIPVQGGLGGGSSDAAAALRGLSRLWQAGLSAGCLADLGRGLGSDVPFFMVGGRALGLGRGDDVRPLEDGPTRFVTLAIPPWGVSTADAYGWHDREKDESGRASLRSNAYHDDTIIYNDLERAVTRVHPLIGSMKEAMVSAGARGAGMSGSGSAVYGLFETLRQATAAAHLQAGSPWLAVVTRTIGREEMKVSVGRGPLLDQGAAGLTG
jgi:4-diphosphocytidyl-2-C-methyl-D-erythritol kinase